MARTPDPTRLESSEAEQVRALVRNVRTLKGTTNAKIAARLKWDIRKVTHALTEERVLLAETAIDLVRAVADVPGRGGIDGAKAGQLLVQFWATADWVKTYRHRTRAVAAVVPAIECERLAEELVGVIAKVNGVRIGAAKRQLISGALKRHLKSRGATMGRTWYELTAPAVSRIVEEAARGEGPWAAELRLQENRKPGSIAHEAVYVAMALGFPAKHGGQQ